MGEERSPLQRTACLQAGGMVAFELPLSPTPQRQGAAGPLARTGGSEAAVRLSAAPRAVAAGEERRRHAALDGESQADVSGLPGGRAGGAAAKTQVPSGLSAPAAGGAASAERRVVNGIHSRHAGEWEEVPVVVRVSEGPALHGSQYALSTKDQNTHSRHDLFRRISA